MTTYDLTRPRENCGLFGVFGWKHPEALADFVALGLGELNHRGHDAAGLAANLDGVFTLRKAQGYVRDVFSIPRMYEGKRPIGHSGIGHTRYKTAGGVGKENYQPFTAQTAIGTVALAHNGQITNHEELRRGLSGAGMMFQSSSDSETLLALLARSAHEPDRVAWVRAALAQATGSFSLLLLTKDALIGARDPHGVRPLMLGRLGEAYILASETCALDIVHADFVREIEPGEMVIITKDGVESHRLANSGALPAFCIFELVYFSRPNSRYSGSSVASTRIAIGQQLAAECPTPADVVVPVLDSGLYPGLGYSQASGIPFMPGILRSHHGGRSFIEPDQEARLHKVDLKHAMIEDLLRGKRAVVVDDSIVRGNTTLRLVQRLREAHVREVHLRIACPQILHPCYLGVDFPSLGELLSHRLEAVTRAIAEHVGADSVEFISLPGLLKACSETDNTNTRFCTGCMNADYRGMKPPAGMAV